MLDKIYKITDSLEKKFPDGNDPFKIITRLTEECGELASQINHFENTGVKKQKHGSPDKKKLAKEAQDVLRCTLQLCKYYNAEKELKASIEESYQRLKKEGLID